MALVRLASRYRHLPRDFRMIRPRIPGRSSGAQCLLASNPDSTLAFADEMVLVRV